MAEIAEIADFLYRYAGTITVVVMIILIAMFASQQQQQAPVTEKISPLIREQFVMGQGFLCFVSQLLEEQNRKGVSLWKFETTDNSVVGVLFVRNIYFSQMLGDKTTVMMTGIVSNPFTVLEITLYNNTGKIIYKNTVRSQPYYPPLPSQASLIFTGREGTEILDWRIFALIPSSEFEEAKTISIKCSIERYWIGKYLL